MKSKTKVGFKYEGRDLESMDFAVRYHKWILNIFKPHLGKTVVEVGAGSGSFTELLADSDAEKIIAIEPSDEMFPLLKGTVEGFDGKTKGEALKGFFSQVQLRIKSEKPSSIVYVNVFEHIDKDEEELKAVYDTLPKGGKICIFVPANSWLMSNFDRKIGHFRRYEKNELKNKVESAGFDIDVLQRFDAIGILPWYVKFRLLGSTSMEAGLTKLYDSVVVPIESRVEHVLPPVIGKNLLLIASKK